MKLSVPDMSCGHCVAAIERTVRELDNHADIRADLASHTVSLTTTTPTDAVLAALRTEGFPATVLA